MNRYAWALPLLAGIAPVLHLGAEQGRTVVELGGLVPLLALVASLAFAAYLAVGLWMTRNPLKRGLLAFVVMAWLGWYAVIRSELGLVESAPWKQVAFLVAWSAIAVWVGFQVIRAKGDLTGRFRWLLLTFAILPVFPVVAVVRAEPVSGAVPVPGPPGEAPPAGLPEGTRPPWPDVYLLVLDKYTAPRTLATTYGFDSTGFLNSLANRGFYLPRRARANYILTELALASMLNWGYLADPPRFGSTRRSRLAAVNAAVRRNRTTAAFRRAGYRYFFLPTGFPITSVSEEADVVVGEEVEPVGPDPVVSWLLRSPLGAPLAGHIQNWIGRNRLFPYPVDTAAEMEARFERLTSLADSAGPKLVFAHLLVPHEPYVFDADCSHREAYWPVDDTADNEDLAKSLYVAQIRCVNQLVLNFIDTVLQADSTAVILLQSDHGHGFLAKDMLRGEMLPLEDLSEEKIADRTSVFAAYRLPGGEGLWYDSISPVNVMPTVVRHLFGIDVERRPDRTFWSEYRKPFDLIRVQ